MASHNNTTFRNLNAAVQGILTNGFGGDVRTDKPEKVHPQILYRFKILSGPDGIPQSVIVKRKQARRIRNEWACLQFLSEQIPRNRVTPYLYGGGYTGKNHAPLIVMEDMGEGQNLRAILISRDKETAKRVLMKCAKALGKIHAHTIGKCETFLKIRDSIVSIDNRSEDFLSVYTEKLTEICHAAGVQPHREAFTELNALTEFLENSTRFHALIHGDLYPVNVYYSTEKSRVYIFDYEFGHFQHVLVGGFQIRVHLDLWAEVARFPYDLMQEMGKHLSHRTCRKLSSSTR